MIGAAKGYEVQLCMPECVSTERRLILEGSAPHVSLTPAKENIDGAIREAHALHGAGARASTTCPTSTTTRPTCSRTSRRTGPEIYRQTDGEVDYFVAGMGTTGTLMGTGRYLKSVKPSVKIVGVEPVMGHTIQGLKNMTESMVPGIYPPDELDDQGWWTTARPSRPPSCSPPSEGLFVGTSAGAAVAVALRIAERSTRAPSS